MGSSEDLIAKLGPPDFSVTADWMFGDKRSRVMHYWLCLDCPVQVRTRAQTVHRHLVNRTENQIDHASFEALAAVVAQLCETDKACSAVYDRILGIWYPLHICLRHKDERQLNTV
jgi:hypothetical protein